MFSQEFLPCNWLSNLLSSTVIKPQRCNERVIINETYSQTSQIEIRVQFQRVGTLG